MKHYFSSHCFKSVCKYVAFFLYLSILECLINTPGNKLPQALDTRTSGTCLESCC